MLELNGAFEGFVEALLGFINMFLSSIFELLINIFGGLQEQLF